MVTNVNRYRCVGPSRHGKACDSPAMMLMAVAWLLSGLLPASASAEILRWKFKPGEVLHYSIDMKTQMNVKSADRERKTSQSQTIDMSWTVQSVAPGGEAEITQRINRVRVKVEMPPYMPFDFDSSNSKAVPAGFEEEAKHLKSMVGLEFSFSMRPTGEVGDIKFPEQTLKAVREAAPREGPDAEDPEKALKAMLIQSSPPPFPEGELEPSKTWKSKQERIPTPVAIMVMERTFTFQGPDPKTPDLLLVGIDTKVALEPVAGVTTKIRKQEGKGSMTIDARSGHMASVRMTQKIDMTVAQTGGQALEQTTETTTSMTLAP
jgi:hypothetical protein